MIEPSIELNMEEDNPKTMKKPVWKINPLYNLRPAVLKRMPILH
jgi:hypothetical protein